MIPAGDFAAALVRCQAVMAGEHRPGPAAHGMTALLLRVALEPHHAAAWAELANALALRSDPAAAACATEAWRCGHLGVHLPVALSAVFEAETAGGRFARAAAVEPRLTVGAAAALWRRLLSEVADAEEAARVVERCRPRANDPASVPAVLCLGMAAAAEAALEPVVSAVDRALATAVARPPWRHSRTAWEQATVRSVWWHVEGRLAAALHSEPRLRRWLHAMEATVDQLLRDGRPEPLRQAGPAMADLIWGWSAAESLIGPLDLAGRLSRLERRVLSMRAAALEETGVLALLLDAQDLCARGELPLVERHIDLMGWGAPYVDGGWTPAQVAGACAEQVRDGDREAALLVGIGWLEHRAQDLRGELGSRYRRGVLDLLAEIQRG